VLAFFDLQRQELAVKIWKYWKPIGIRAIKEYI